MARQAEQRRKEEEERKAKEAVNNDDDDDVRLRDFLLAVRRTYTLYHIVHSVCQCVRMTAKHDADFCAFARQDDDDDDEDEDTKKKEL